MSDVKITVGGDMVAEAGRRFVDAWHRAERGEDVCERRLAFETWDTLARILTGKRMELIRYVRHHDVGSIRQLAVALNRDYSNVHADVKALSEHRLLTTTGGRIRADYDAIETTITL